MDKDLERIKERTANILDKEGEGDWEVTEEQEVSSRDRIEVMYSNFEQLDDGKLVVSNALLRVFYSNIICIFWKKLEV